MRILCVALCIFVMPLLAHAQTTQSVSETPTVPTLTDVNPEMLRTVIADQWDRGMDMFGGRPAKMATAPDWQAVAIRDKNRQATVRALLTKGELKSGRDYQFAALVFQHSESANDLQVAHLLAATAALKGQPTARWLAAAALRSLPLEYESAAGLRHAIQAARRRELDVDDGAVRPRGSLRLDARRMVRRIDQRAGECAFCTQGRPASRFHDHIQLPMRGRSR